MLKGRIEGRNADGEYRISQGDTVLKAIPIAEARQDAKLARTIRQNGWEPVK